MNQLYNGMTLQQIENNLPKNIHHIDKQIYLSNVKEYIKLGNTNKRYKECILNSNFEIIKRYL